MKRLTTFLRRKGYQNGITPKLNRPHAAAYNTVTRHLGSSVDEGGKSSWMACDERCGCDYRAERIGRTGVSPALFRVCMRASARLSRVGQYAGCKLC